MPGLVPGIHVFILKTKDVDGRDKPGHDGGKKDPYARPLGSGERSASSISR